MHNPLTIPSDIGLEGFDRQKFVQWEQRQPAEVSWWICPDAQFHAIAEQQVARMMTSPFSRIITRILE